MEINRGVLIVLCLAMASLAAVANAGEKKVYAANGEEKKILTRTVRGQKQCLQGWECPYYSKFCCNETIGDVFQVYQFENLFSTRNSPVAHAVGSWDYQSFILASVHFQPLGFCTTGGKQMQMKELAAFLAHVGAKTSCEFFSPFLFGFGLRWNEFGDGN